jgi:predicted permease
MAMILWQDIRYAFRTLLKNPAFSAIAVISLALGIGANTTIFTIVNAVFLNPLPVEEPQTLVALYTSDENIAGGFSTSPMSRLNFEDFRSQNDGFEDMAAAASWAATLLVETTPEQLPVTIVTANYFDVLGVNPVLGRTFFSDEDQGLGSYPVAVVSHTVWSRLFGGDPAAVGKTFSMNSQPFTLIGVTPPEFKGVTTLGNPDQVWVTLSMRQQITPQTFWHWFEERRPLLFNAYGRLKQGVTLAQAEIPMKAIAARLEQEYPNDNKGRGVALVPIADAAVGVNQRDGMVRAGAVLMSVVGLVLLIACVNLANLMLARGATRTKEISLRAALGAGRRRIVSQLMTESIVLAMFGGGAGLLVAYWGRSLIWSFRPVFLNENAIELTLDTRVLGFTIGISLVTGVLFGLLPAFKASSPDLHEALKVGGRQQATGFGRSPLRSLLVVSEVALAVVTLIGAGLFVRSMQAALRVDPGFESQNLFVFAMNLASRGYGPEQGRQYYRNAMERAQTVPGVESATMAANFPLGGGLQRTVIREDLPPDPNFEGRLSIVTTVAPNYFETLRIPLVRGRLFTEFDREGSTLAVVINEAMAERYWAGEDPMRRRFHFLGQDSLVREVVGIVRNVAIGQIGGDPQSMAYMPLGQNYPAFGTLQVRTAGDPEAVMGTVMREVQTLDPELALTFQSTIGQILGQALWARRMGAALLGIFGLLALVLAAVGIYGVMSYTSNQRRQEIGIRMAIGAPTGRILTMVLSQGMIITGIGIAVGLAGSLAITRFASSLLFGVSAVDPLTYSGIAAILLLVSLAATYLPARRATKVDPLIALRNE